MTSAGKNPPSDLIDQIDAILLSRFQSGESLLAAVFSSPRRGRVAEVEQLVDFGLHVDGDSKGFRARVCAVLKLREQIRQIGLNRSEYARLSVLKFEQKHAGYRVKRA